MKSFLLRLSLAAAATLLSLARTSSAPTSPAPAYRGTATREQSATPQSTQGQNDAQSPTSSDVQTEEAHSFTGRVVKESGQLVLKDPVTKVSYRFNDPAKAKQYAGRQVRVRGKLDLDTNTIHIESIKPLS